ncbi:MAG TPA: 5-formyltetrahydrofolate cyclo-ligase [Vulgatibacter sp.]|nr:5-formyltetrahydrofolate cyclo-ligase [Vulgatibacter sp.]
MPPSKSTLRARLVAERRAVPAAELAAGSEAIVRRILDLPEIAAARVVTLYRPLKGELAVEPLWHALEARGVECLFPRVVRGTKVLAFGTADSLRPGVWGILEPAPGSERALSSIDAFVVPGVAFDEMGGRMGHGAGYYDATLAAAPRALRIGACLDRFLLAELPRERHDQSVDLLVTSTRTLRFESRGMLESPA